MADRCYGCKHLFSGLYDGAGGYHYYCRLLSPDGPGGIVKGSTGHWTNETDEPRPSNDHCYEAQERKEGDDD